MLDSRVIEACKPEDVKCVSAKCVSVTMLAQKMHQGKGLSLEELQHRINNECIVHGIEPRFDLPPRTVPTPDDNSSEEPKWCIFQNFAQINKVTKVSPMPQGDIRVKQQQLSGHRWVSGFNFTAGFYVIPVHPESRPYMEFYMEGKGYFWYIHMPFCLTGSPLMFANIMARHMSDLLKDETMELFIDNRGSAADTLDDMMNKLTQIFTKVHEKGLSLSASKTELFMTKISSMQQ